MIDDRPVTAIIWDYDGTLVDTRAKNWRITRNLVRRFTGADPDDIEGLTELDLERHTGYAVEAAFDHGINYFYWGSIRRPGFGAWTAARVKCASYLLALTWLATMSVPAVLAQSGAVTKRALGAMPAVAMLVAVGFIVRLNVAVLIFIGGALAWLIGIPLLGGAEGVVVANADFIGGYALWVDENWMAYSHVFWRHQFALFFLPHHRVKSPGQCLDGVVQRCQVCHPLQFRVPYLPAAEGDVLPDSAGEEKRFLGSDGDQCSQGADLQPADIRTIDANTP